MNYTKGEWKVAKRTTNGVEGFEVHWSDDGECITDHVYTEDDARLIAAAPEMYEALKGLIKQMERGDEIYNRGECDSVEFEDAKRALSKAEGKTE